MKNKSLRLTAACSAMLILMYSLPFCVSAQGSEYKPLSADTGSYLLSYWKNFFKSYIYVYQKIAGVISAIFGKGIDFAKISDKINTESLADNVMAIIGIILIIGVIVYIIIMGRNTVDSYFDGRSYVDVIDFIGVGNDVDGFFGFLLKLAIAAFILLPYIFEYMIYSGFFELGVWSCIWRILVNILLGLICGVIMSAIIFVALAAAEYAVIFVISYLLSPIRLLIGKIKKEQLTIKSASTKIFNKIYDDDSAFLRVTMTIISVVCILNILIFHYAPLIMYFTLVK